MKAFLVSALSLAVSIAPSVLAEDRPSEGWLFGETPHSPQTEKKDAFASGDVKDDALTVGGNYYQRLVVSPQDGVKPGDTPLAMPLQFDAFLDARPSDRVRGFVDGRLFFDASRGGTGSGGFQFSSISTAPTSGGVSNPQVGLDQAWLKFDIDRSVFVTAGKQHVKWGSSRFWNPTDVLHTQRRDPLSPTDLRLGNTMVRLAIPWEATKTSFSAIALFDNPQPAGNLGQLGGAFRAETVILGAEIGAEAVTRGGTEPFYGADLSAPLGPFDVYFEGAYVAAPRLSFYQVNAAGLTPGVDIDTVVTTVTRQGPFFQVSGGANFQFAWKDNRVATLGVEYFFNGLGYSDGRVYPALIFFGRFQPFYTGRNYAAAYLTAEGPDAQKRTTYTLSTLANLSDGSFITRLDFSWRVLTYLTFEAFAGVHYGTRGGEFRFAQSTPAVVYQARTIPAVEIPPTIVDVGMGLRLGF